MRSIGKSGAGWPLVFVFLVVGVLLAFPGALRAQQPAARGPLAKPPEIVVHNCKVSGLIAAIVRANSTAAADTIVLKKGCTYTVTGPVGGNGDGLPRIVNPLTIRGNGATIARDPSAGTLQLLHVRGWTAPEGFFVDHLTVRGGSAPQGAAIFVHPWFTDDGPLAMSPAVTVTDSTFIDNATVRVDYFDPDGVGGAISVQGMPGTTGKTVTLRNDVFTGNSTHGGPAPADPNSWDQRAGGAVFIGWFVGPTEIVGSTFTSNWTGDAPVGGTGWQSSDGGAVVSYAPLTTITDSIFNRNHTGSGGGGGAIYVTPSFGPGQSTALTLERSTFDGNSSSVGGGAIAVRSGMSPASLTVAGGTFSDNSATGQGGAIWADHATVTLLDSTFTGTSTADGGPGGWGGGGGAISSSQSLTVERSTFSSNSAGDGGDGDPQGGDGGHGGAIAVVGQGTLTVVDGTFTSNSAGNGGDSTSAGGAGGRGGGIYTEVAATVAGSSFETNHAGTAGTNWPGGGGFGTGGGISAWAPLTVTNSTFTGNTAFQGGGIWSIYTGGPGVTTITGSTFSGNTAAQNGGGIQFLFGTLNIANSTFHGNTVAPQPGYWGGAIGIYLGTADVTNSTLSGNSAGYGGGIAGDGTAMLRNTVVAANTGSFAGVEGNCAVWGGGTLDGGGNLRWPASDTSCVGAYGDPMLMPLADNGGPTWTMALGPGSAAIDTAVDALCPPTDQRGVTRPQGPHCDIGAYELAP